MNTKDASKRWGYSVKLIRSFCEYKYIPLAEMINLKWDIPNRAAKPPLSVDRALSLLEKIDHISEGACPDFTKFGIPLKTIKSTYTYLADIAWCSRVNWATCNGKIDFITSLKDVQITPLGREKIRKKNARIQKKRKYGGKVKLPVGPAQMEVSYETEAIPS